MKASELILYLEKLVKVDGDLPVMIIKNTESADIEDIDLRGISTCMGDKDEKKHFLLCDDDTFGAFCD